MYRDDHKSILRWSPIEDNKPDNKDSIRQVSGVLGEYVIGNQMKRYKAGAYGTVLAQQRDQQGNMWSFVLIDGLEESSVFGEVSQPGWVWEGKAPQNEVATKHQTKDKNPTEKAAEQKVPETELGRLVNDFTGSSRCLRSTSNGQVALLPCSSNRNDNRWILAPSNQQGFAILKRQSVDSNQCLTLEDSGRMLMKACNPAANGQMWGFTMWQGDDHRARIQNILFGEQWCLDVINDGTNNRVHMAECGNYSGQAWGE